MKKSTSITCFALTSLLLSPLVHAYGNEAGDLSISAGGGYYYFDGKREINNHGLPFGIVGFNMSDRWSMEAMLGGFVTTFKDSAHDDREINATLFTIDALYRFGDFCMIEPYVFAGVGVLGLSHNRYDANNEGNINAGVGAQYFIADTLAFRADVRDLYTITGGKNDVMVNFGMTVLFSLC